MICYSLYYRIINHPLIMLSISKLCNWYFSKYSLPYWLILVFDSLIVFCSTYFVFLLFHVSPITIRLLWSLFGTVSFYMIFYLIGFKIMRTYQGVLRHSSFIDIQNSFFAILIGASLIIIFRSLFKFDSFLIHIPIKIFLVSVILSTLLMGLMRMIVKYLYDFFFNVQMATPAYIYGAMSGGAALGKSIRSEKPAKYLLKGFVSAKEDIACKNLLGVHVYSITDSLVRTMVRNGIKNLLISPLKSDEFREESALQSELLKAGIHIMMLPQAQEWDGKSDISHRQLKEVDIEDLLPRDKIVVDMKEVGESLFNKSVLITGAAGSIGSEIVQQVASFHPKLMVLVDQAESPMHDVRRLMARKWPEIPCQTIVTTICNINRMEEIFREYTPEYVFHAAAYKHVPMMEDNPREAVQNNVYGTKIIADMAVKYGTGKFVMVSTDKAVNPTNVMGCSKRICEIYVQSLDRAIKEGRVPGVTQFVTTRFGNVIGSNGSVIPIFREQIKHGGPVTVTDPNIIRYFMLIPEACKLVLEAGTMGNGGEIFVFDMGRPVRIADLAQHMIDLSGAKNVKIVYTGLRDGEKLYEELLSDEERSKPTFHPKIKIASVREEDYEVVNEEIIKLQSNTYIYNDMDIVREMKHIVPEFISKNSKYEALDN